MFERSLTLVDNSAFAFRYSCKYFSVGPLCTASTMASSSFRAIDIAWLNSAYRYLKDHRGLQKRKHRRLYCRLFRRFFLRWSFAFYSLNKVIIFVSIFLFMPRRTGFLLTVLRNNFQRQFRVSADSYLSTFV